MRIIQYGVLFVAATELLACATSASEPIRRNSSAVSDGDGNAPGTDDIATARPPENFDTVPGLADDSGQAVTLYRGAAPDHAGLLYLQQLGVQTIVCLERGKFPDDFEGESKNAVDAEEADAESLGMRFVRAPLSAWLPVDSAQVENALSTIVDPAAQAVYVHCLHGQDRTGLVVGLERVQHGGMAPAEAHQDMLDHGFHMALPFLNHYFEEQTGWED